MRAHTFLYISCLRSSCVCMYHLPLMKDSEPEGSMSHAISSPAVPTLGRRGWAALLVLCGALFLDALDVSMIGVALPSIRTDLHMSTSSLQWVVSAYVLGYGGFLLLGGRAADLLGRRKV